MKRLINYTLFLLISFVFILGYPKADSCNYKEQSNLTKEASNINIKYEIVDKTDEMPKSGAVYSKNYYYIQVSIYNLSPNMYIEMTNDLNKEKVVYRYSDATDGIISFKKPTESVIKYTFNIYAETANCNMRLRTKSLTVPRFNQYYNNGVCQELKDFKYCQELITSTADDSEIVQKINAEYDKLVAQRKANLKKDNIFIKILKISGIVILILGVLGATGYIVYIKVIKKGKKV